MRNSRKILPRKVRWISVRALIWLGIFSLPAILPGAYSGLSGLVPGAWAADAADYHLTGVSPERLNNGSTAIDLQFDQVPSGVNQFIMADPPRAVIDIPMTANATDQRIIKVDKGEVESVMLVGNDERLRMIVNLNRAAEVVMEDIENGYRVYINPVDRRTEVSSTEMERTINRASSQQDDDRAMLTGVDFRRTANGTGRVVVSLDRPDVVVDFKEQSGELIADFIDTAISDEDEQRLDVVDFATPVSSIDMFRMVDNARMVITPNGQFKHTVTQQGDQFIVEVSPLTQQEIKALNQDEAGYSGETLSLNFQSIPVRAALQVIADFTGFNIITSDSVTGDLTLRLNDVPWDQALDLILQTKNLGMRQKGNVIRVAPADEINAQELREYEAQKEVVELEPLTIELIKVSYAKAQDIADLLKSIRTVDPNIAQPAFGSVTVNEIVTEENNLLSARGSVSVDERTNTLLVQDTPTQIREIRKLVKKLDIPVRQVQIETRIVEATDDFSRSLGARLGFTRITRDARLPGTSSDNSLGTVFQSGTLGGAGVNNDPADDTDRWPDRLSVNLPADGLGDEIASSYAYQIAKLGAGYLQLLDLEISALQAEGKGKIIANPKITTTNSHEAMIEQGQERIFVTGSLVDTGSVTKKAVLSLTVSPQITPDEKVILDVHITNDTFDSQNTLNTKRITTQSLLGNGETIVIGGIYQQSKQDQTTKTPILGDIPVLGNLFKKNTRQDNRTELLIFLTPRIIYSEFDSTR